MPIHQNQDGTWQWGQSGKKYRNKADAIKQMQAIFANGYREPGQNKTASLLYKIAYRSQWDLNNYQAIAAGRHDPDVFPEPQQLNTAPNPQSNYQRTTQPSPSYQVPAQLRGKPAYLGGDVYPDQPGTRTAVKGDSVWRMWDMQGRPGTWQQFQDDWKKANGSLDMKVGQKYSLGKWAD